MIVGRHQRQRVARSSLWRRSEHGPNVCLTALLYCPWLLMRCHTHSDPHIVTILCTMFLFSSRVVMVNAGYTLPLSPFCNDPTIPALPYRYLVAARRFRGRLPYTPLGTGQAACNKRSSPTNPHWCDLPTVPCSSSSTSTATAFRERSSSPHRT